MSRYASFHVDRISLRLRGVSATTARAAAGRIGDDVAARLAPPVRGAALGDVHAGPITVDPNVTATRLSAVIADRTAHAIDQAAREAAR
jgi:hypothetical protein